MENKRRHKRLKSWQIMQRHHLEYKCKCGLQFSYFRTLDDFLSKREEDLICHKCGGKTKEKVVKLTRTEHFFCGRLESYFKAHGCTPGMRRAMNYYGKKYLQRRIKLL